MNCDVSYNNACRVLAACPRLSKFTLHRPETALGDAFFENVPPCIRDVEFPPEYNFRSHHLRAFLSKGAPHLRRFVAVPEMFPLGDDMRAPSLDLGETLPALASKGIEAISMSTDMLFALTGQALSETLTGLALCPSYNERYPQALAALAPFSLLRSLTLNYWFDPFEGQLPPLLESLALHCCYVGNCTIDPAVVPKGLVSLSLTEVDMPDTALVSLLRPTLTKLSLRDQDMSPLLLKAIKEGLPRLETFSWNSTGDQLVFPSLESSLGALKDVAVEKCWDNAPSIIFEEFCKELARMPRLDSLALNGFVRPPKFILDILLPTMCRVTKLDLVGTSLASFECLANAQARHLVVSPPALLPLCLWPNLFVRVELLGCNLTPNTKNRELTRFIRTIRKGLTVYTF
jgi:hypothetical protein